MSSTRMGKLPAKSGVQLSFRRRGSTAEETTQVYLRKASRWSRYHAWFPPIVCGLEISRILVVLLRFVCFVDCVDGTY